jgi:hypothetical protein
MERHPVTAILITCSSCDLVRMADDYGSAHARGNAHIRLSGHSTIKYSQVEAPERIKGALMAAKGSWETMTTRAGVTSPTVEASAEPDEGA